MTDQGKELQSCEQIDGGLFLCRPWPWGAWLRNSFGPPCHYGHCPHPVHGLPDGYDVAMPLYLLTATLERRLLPGGHSAGQQK